LSRHSRRHR